MAWTKQCACKNFIPDEHNQCDWCLLAKYNLLEKRYWDNPRGFEPYYIEEDAVVEALRKAERRSVL